MSQTYNLGNFLLIEKDHWNQQIIVQEKKKSINQKEKDDIFQNKFEFVVCWGAQDRFQKLIDLTIYTIV